jgi:biotin carboxyl carrier protein
VAFEERPSPSDGRRRPARRDPEARAHDHDQIDRLTDDLLPDLIDRLAASGLGELEVREDDWRIRLRLPGGTVPTASAPAEAGRGADRSSRGATGRPVGAAAGPTPPATSNGAIAQATTPPTPAASGGDGRGNGTAPAGGASGPHRVIAISPAVGVFQPRPELRAGARVRQGDRLGAVDLLGVPQDVVAPEDGIVVDTLAEAGEGVEYGQDLVVIEPARNRQAGDPFATAPLSES